MDLAWSLSAIEPLGQERLHEQLAFLGAALCSVFSGVEVDQAPFDPWLQRQQKRRPQAKPADDFVPASVMRAAFRQMIGR